MTSGGTTDLTTDLTTAVPGDIRTRADELLRQLTGERLSFEPLLERFRERLA